MKQSNNSSSHWKRFAAASPLRIGLLGGSFNPAHEGHLHISLQAMKRLKLDAVWWIVSPANPLKDPASLAPFAMRYAYAQAMVANHPRIYLCDAEMRYHLRYTIDTVRALRKRFPQHQFVWLMGSDNLGSFHHWKQWEAIASALPVAVLDRSSAIHRCLRMRFAVRFAAFRHAGHAPPTWSTVFIRRHPLSATHLRKTLGENAFSRYNNKIK